MVFAEAIGGIADSPQLLDFDIGLPSDVIKKLVRERIEKNPVDREVAAGGV